MKKALLIVSLTIFLLGSLFSSRLRASLKEVLPRSGEVEIAGGVYTPFLLDNSPFYVLKELEETADLFITADPAQKAYLKLTFANKRLLEAEMLTRSGDKERVRGLVGDFLKNFNEAVAFADGAEANGKNMEKFGWFFQESVYDQQRVFDLILSRVPEESRGEIVQIKEQVVESSLPLSSKIYGFDVKDF